MRDYLCLVYMLQGQFFEEMVEAKDWLGFYIDKFRIGLRDLALMLSFPMRMIGWMNWRHLGFLRRFAIGFWTQIM